MTFLPQGILLVVLQEAWSSLWLTFVHVTKSWIIRKYTFFIYNSCCIAPIFEPKLHILYIQPIIKTLLQIQNSKNVVIKEKTILIMGDNQVMRKYDDDDMKVKMPACLLIKNTSSTQFLLFELCFIGFSNSIFFTNYRRIRTRNVEQRILCVYLWIYLGGQIYAALWIPGR